MIRFLILIFLYFIVTLIGGVVFLLFAITSSIWDPNAEDSPKVTEQVPGN
jgi:hypothetical protein